MMEITRIESKQIWNELLLDIGSFDIYHTYDFHYAHSFIDNGQPVLFHIQNNDSFIVLPLLERGINNSNLKDATSVYGYPGPLSNIDQPHLFELTWGELCNYLCDKERYISIFSRLNTLCLNNTILASNFSEAGKTVNLNLQLSETEQVQQYRSNLRRDINKLVAKGFSCELMSYSEGIDDFINIYNETMSGLSAQDYYLFPEDYYANLFDNDLVDLKIVICKNENEIACVGIFSFTNKIVQYHLGGASNLFYRDGPMKLMIDFVRKFASAEGFENLHLGGGLGGSEDNLFNFKRGFSSDIKSFYVCRQILNSDIYLKLSKGKSASNFFPLYRS